MRVFLILLLSIQFLWAGDVEEFKAKAEPLKNEIEKAQKKYNKAEKQYAGEASIIQEIKSAEKDNFFSNLRLKIHLGRANKAAYEMFKAGEAIKEIKDEHDTYALIIIEECGNEFEKCLKDKCGKAEEIFNERREWVKAVENYRDILSFDVILRDISGRESTDAKKDILSYIEKKLIQSEQRIYILKEEIRILMLAQKAGIETGDSSLANANEKLKELLKIYEYLKKEKEKL